MLRESVTTLGWSAEIRHADDAFDDLAGDWAGLVARCATATPFQSYAWLRSWWRAYGKPGTLRLALVHRDGVLVAAAPLMLRRRAGCPVLAPLGEPFADFTDVLVADDAAGAAPRLAAALLDEPGWQAIDLPETRPGSAADVRLAPAWPGRLRRTPASLCLELPASELEDLVRDLPAHSRKTVRRRLNQLGRAGIEVREVEPADAGRAVADLLRLHARQWQGRGGNPAHRTPRFEQFLIAAVRDMLADGSAALLEYRLDGRLTASSLVVIGRELAGGYLYGAEPELRERVDVTTMLLADVLPLAHRRGCPTMSMLRGAEEHKRRWRPVESHHEGLLLARPGSAAGAAYALGVSALRRARRTARDRAPWLRAVRARLGRLPIGGRR
jgi:CelD/BcsL family acetyltransferase involved in cellulose biosynthesis